MVLDFEKDYVENSTIREVTVDGYRFLDRNGNGALDAYEDERRSADERVDDLLAQMTLDEKVHVLKGSGMASALRSSITLPITRRPTALLTIRSSPSGRCGKFISRVLN